MVEGYLFHIDPWQAESLLGVAHRSRVNSCGGCMELKTGRTQIIIGGDNNERHGPVGHVEGTMG